MPVVPHVDRIPVKDRIELSAFIEKAIRDEGPFCDLNHLDVSRVTNFNGLFYRSAFLGDISQWDMSGATTMSGMFEQCKFNGDISKWDVSNVVNMERMFNRSPFDRDISAWNTGNVENMAGLFWGSKFNGDISRWDVSKVQDMTNMFDAGLFKGDISRWSTGNVHSMAAMFQGSPFNGDLSNWDVSKVTTFASMFAHAIFQGDVSRWDTSSATDMSAMFLGSAYRSHLSNVSAWDVRKVTTFYDMFMSCDVPDDLSAWQFGLYADLDHFMDTTDIWKCTKPSMYHWYTALAQDQADLLRLEDQQFLQKHGDIVSALSRSTMESAAMLQQMWLREHTPALRHATSLALPDLGSMDGVGL